MPEPTVLLVNKFYHDVGPAGGVGRYLLQEEEDLAAAGWRVVPFAMADADARPSPWARWFVSAHDYRRPRWSLHAPADALALVWNREAARRLDALLREARPGVAHLHNVYHHLSPAILPVLARHGVPAVMTLHDLRLLCPAIHMLRGGRVHTRCWTRRARSRPCSATQGNSTSGRSRRFFSPWKALNTLGCMVCKAPMDSRA